MRMKAVVLCGMVLGAASVASAQTKWSGQEQCAKPEPQYTVPVGDKADHVVVLGKAKCTWSAGEIGGVKIKEADDTVISDVSGGSSSDRGYAAVSMEDGDTAFVRWEGKATVKDKAPSDGHGTWAFVSGTGKLKGIKGKGTYKGKWNPDGTGTFGVEGTYTLAVPKTK